MLRCTQSLRREYDVKIMTPSTYETIIAALGDSIVYLLEQNSLPAEATDAREKVEAMFQTLATFMGREGHDDLEGLLQHYAFMTSGSTSH